jgi:hypothetical protein
MLRSLHMQPRCCKVSLTPYPQELLKESASEKPDLHGKEHVKGRLRRVDRMGQ